MTLDINKNQIYKKFWLPDRISFTFGEKNFFDYKTIAILLPYVIMGHDRETPFLEEYHTYGFKFVSEISYKRTHGWHGLTMRLFGFGIHICRQWDY